MIVKQVKKQFGYLLGLAGLLVLGGCLIENSTEDGGSFSSESEMAVLSITPPAGEGAGTVITQSAEYECDGATLITETETDTSRYIIADGKLYLWSDGACSVDIVLSGSSSTITGTWTTNSFSASVPVPEAHRPEDCEYDEESEDAFTDIFRNVNATYTISNTSVNSKLTGALCITPIYAQVFTTLGDSLEIAASSCENATLRNAEANKTATVTSVYQDGMITTTFSHGDSVCAVFQPFNFSEDPPVCTEDEDGEEEEGEEEEVGDTFFPCLLGSGFYGEAALEKKPPTESWERKLKAVTSPQSFPR